MSTMAKMNAVLNRHPHCAVCRGTSWQYSQAGGALIETFQPMSHMVPGPMIQSYVAICTSCGSFRFVAKSIVEAA